MAEQPGNIAMRLQQLYGGGLVKDSKTAEKLAEVLIEGQYGEAELDRQKPLQLTDSGDKWLIVGKPAGAESQIAGIGRISIAIDKSDAKVVEFRSEYKMMVPPEAQRAIEKYNKEKK